jgi:hypothetical protein
VCERGCYSHCGDCHSIHSLSFLRHADLSPDVHEWSVCQNGNLQKKIPVVTHRSDESGRVFLAGCSPAEPASASSTASEYQVFITNCQRVTGRSSRQSDCATGTLVPDPPLICFEVGRFTLTQSSWTALSCCSRKWMSGHAARALVAAKKLEDTSKTPTLVSRRLETSLPPSAGKSPFSFDSYLSWMSLCSLLKLRFFVDSIPSASPFQPE